MPASDRPAAVAAALEFLRKSSYRSGAHDRVPEMMRHNCKVDEAIALLREPQPEPGNVLPPHVCDGSGCCKEAQPEPAPVGGEDEALLARIDSVIEEYLLASLRTCQDRAVHKMEQLLVDLGTRLRAALADVARLNRIIDSWKAEEEWWIKRDKQMEATIAAVRRIAENNHDVDVTGDPPREVACNPCANEILNALDARAGRNDG